MHSTRWMDERIVTSAKCWIGNEEKMPDISREVNQMNWLRIGHVSTLSRGKFGNLIRRSWWMWKLLIRRSWWMRKVGKLEKVTRTAWWMKKVQNIVTDEELVQNGVMDKKSWRMMGLSIFSNGGWNILQPSNRKLLEDFIDENEPWLLIGIRSRDSFFNDTVLGTTFSEFGSAREGLMPLREGIHVGM